ncbi:hypothetical protein ASPFODRAFT_42968, partial [Aspergillus luchuensis CBS 106.47]
MEFASVLTQEVKYSSSIRQYSSVAGSKLPQSEPNPSFRATSTETLPLLSRIEAAVTPSHPFDGDRSWQMQSRNFRNTESLDPDRATAIAVAVSVSSSTATSVSISLSVSLATSSSTFSTCAWLLPLV